MDPATAATLAIFGIETCTKTVKMIKRSIEAVRNVRKDLLDLMQEIEQVKNIFELLQVLTQQLVQTQFKSMQLALDKRGIEATLLELQTVASDIANIKHSSSLLAGLHWNFSKSTAQKLAGQLRRRKTDLLDVIAVINSTASLKTLAEVQSMKDEALRSVHLTEAFRSFSIRGEAPAIQTPDDAAQVPQNWLGYSAYEGHSELYIRKRHLLSESAYWGDFAAVFELIQYGKSEFDENWANAYRLKPGSEALKTSGWTPLHQAVYNRASVEDIQKLISAGSFRKHGTQRTLHTEFGFPNMTALELAQELELYHLEPILAPVIHQPIPAYTLDNVQDNFHALLKRDLGDAVDHWHIRLPILEMLTELRVPLMWFHVKFHQFSPAGYAYRLDGRELVVQSYNIHENNAVVQYRITDSDVLVIEEALLINAQ